MLALNSNDKLFLGKSLRHHIVPNSDHSFLNEVHVGHFIFLVQNKLIMLSILKLCWLQSKADVIYELGVDVFVGVEENAISEDDVIE